MVVPEWGHWDMMLESEERMVAAFPVGLDPETKVARICSVPTWWLWLSALVCLCRHRGQRNPGFAFPRPESRAEKTAKGPQCPPRRLQAARLPLPGPLQEPEASQLPSSPPERHS